MICSQSKKKASPGQGSSLSTNVITMQNTPSHKESQIHYAPQLHDIPQSYDEQRCENENGEFSVFTHPNGQELSRADIAYLKLILQNTEATFGQIEWEAPEDIPTEYPVPTDKVTRIYLMRNRANGLWKIGHSRKPQYRERTLQSQEPDVELFCHSSGTLNDERYLHGLFAHRRKRGEWFELSESDALTAAAYLESIDNESHVKITD